jgi:hypothetical protein
LVNNNKLRIVPQRMVLFFYAYNYMSKYEDLFKLGLVVVTIGLICYGV